MDWGGGGYCVNMLETDRFIKDFCGLVQFVLNASALSLVLPEISVVSFCLCLCHKISCHGAVERVVGSWKISADGYCFGRKAIISQGQVASVGNSQVQS